MRLGAARRRVAALLAAGVVGLSGCAGGGTTAASCAGPLATVSPSSAAPGQTVQVSAQWLHSGCDDHGVNGAMADEEEPLTDVVVDFVQDGAHTELARVDATGEQYSAVVEVVVPAGAVAGPASVVVGGAAVDLQISG